MVDKKIDALMGLILVNVANNGDEIVFQVANGETYKLYHSQDCCENVKVEDVVGELADLVGAPILRAEERSSSGTRSEPAPAGAPKPGEYSESWTWTFYELATVKGSVTIRWLGESNGYYSESVDFAQVA